MRRRGWLALMVAVALSACDDDGAGMDGGSDAAALIGADAGVRDAAARDGGSADGGSADGGPASEDGGFTDGGHGSRDGGPADDAGASECPAAAVLIGETCPSFAACGGAFVEGDYCFEGLCIEESELLAPMAPYCATIVLEAANGTASGRVSLSSGDRITRTSEIMLEVRARIPSNCVVVSCDEVGALIAREVPDSTVRCAMTDACRCDIVIRAAIDVTDGYTTAAPGVLTIGAGPTSREYDYCVEAGGSMRLRHRAGDPAELGTHSIALIL